MSNRRKNKDGSERKVHSNAKLKGLPEEQRKLVAGWLDGDGWESCLQRLRSELGISTGKTALYEAMAYWRSQERFNAFASIARSQAELEREARGGMTPDEMEEAIDRNFLALAAQMQDAELYKDIRYLRVADQSAKTKAALEQEKLKLRQIGEARAKETLALEREKFKAAIRTKVEAGLAEIAEQVKGNTAAEAALKRLQEAIQS